MRVLTGSRPLNGSSRISRSGLCIVAPTSWTFCDMPFDNSSQRFSSMPDRPTRSSAAAIFPSSPGPSAPLRRARYLRNAPTFILL